MFYWSLGALLLAFIYPFMKRHTHLPQVVLAAAFGWAVPMAYVATLGHVSVWGWVLFVAYMCWTVAYDTEYAMCDRDDDVKIGVKSTAILFGRYDVMAIMMLMMVFLILMALSFMYYFGLWAKWLLLPVLGLFVYQYLLIQKKQRLDCFKAFRHNAWVGRYVFLVTVIVCVWLFG